MNNASTQLASGATDFVSKTVIPGLVRPDQSSLTVSGKVVNVSLPSPFGILWGSGLFSTAHGTTAGQDTQSYTADFTSLFPVTGSITALILASYVQVPQNPITITGPPMGQTGFNPAFVPYTAYTVMRDSISIQASLSAADNSTTFELGRCILNAGSGAVSGLTTQYQVQNSQLDSKAVLNLYTSTQLSIAETGAYFTTILNDGLTITLPPSPSCPGSIINIYGYYSSGSTIVPYGSEVLLGAKIGGGNVNSYVLLPNSAATFWTDGGNWRLISMNLAAVPPDEWSAGDVNSLNLGGLVISNGTLTINPNSGLNINGSNQLSIDNFSSYTSSMSGWVTLPNGMIDQWGFVSAPADSTPHIYNLATSFSSEFFNIVISYAAQVPPASGNIGAQSGSLSTIIITNTAPNGGPNNGCFWRAIGI